MAALDRNRLGFGILAAALAVLAVILAARQLADADTGTALDGPAATVFVAVAAVFAAFAAAVTGKKGTAGRKGRSRGRGAGRR